MMKKLSWTMSVLLFTNILFGLNTVKAFAPGDLDTTFGTGGKVITPVGTANDFAYDMAIQADGKILLASAMENGAAVDIAVVRYNANGSLDTSFGTGGKVSVSLGSEFDFANSTVIQPDGKILVGGVARESADSLHVNQVVIRLLRLSAITTATAKPT